MDVGPSIAFITALVGVLTSLVALLQAVKAAREGETHLKTCIAFARASKEEVRDTLRSVVDQHIAAIHLELKREVQAIISREMSDIRKHLLKDQGE